MKIAKCIVKTYNVYFQQYCVFIGQQNQGLGTVRNSSLELSTGKHICFLDLDDKILPNYLSTLSKTIDEEKYYIMDLNLTTSSNEALEWCKGRYYSTIELDD